MKAIVFAYHDMGLVGLNALLRHGYEIPLVFTHADDPAETQWFDSVADWCAENNIKCMVSDDINALGNIEMVERIAPDFIFSFYFRTMLCKQFLAIPRLGALNLHSSLLPKYRGRAPVNWVLVNGEKTTGVTLHYMVEKPDAGDIVDQDAVAIAENDTALTLFRKLESAAVLQLDRMLPMLKKETAGRRQQDHSEATYFGRRGPEDGLINWDKSARDIYNLVRAVTHPYPGAFACVGGRRLNVWWVEVSERSDLVPGEMIEDHDGVFVGTGQGALKLIEFE